MSVLFDDRYEDLAAEFQYRQVEMLKKTLERHGIEKDVAQKICGEFTFDLAVLFDQGGLEVDGEEWRPCVAFTADEETFYAQPGDVAYHEYAFGTTKDVYTR